MNHDDPVSVYSEFYCNPAIESLARFPRWTVADSEGVPINLKALIATGYIWGAHEVSEQCLVTLDEITHDLPNAANCTFYLRGQNDDVALLIINPSCPPVVARGLLSIPHLYSEYRMNGSVGQLLFRLPTNFNFFLSVRNRKVLVEEHGWYEIVFEGWVTFSRSALHKDATPAVEEPRKPHPAWNELYAALARKTRPSRVASWNIRLQEPEAPRLEQVLELIVRKPLDSTLQDFHGNYLLYEYSALAELYGRLRPVLDVIRDLEPDALYDDTVQAWLIFQGALRMLEHRSYDPKFPQDAPLLKSAAVSVVILRPLFEDASA